MAEEFRRLMPSHPVVTSKTRKQLVTTLPLDGTCNFAAEDFIPSGAAQVGAIGAVNCSIEPQASAQRAAMRIQSVQAVKTLSKFHLTDFMAREQGQPPTFKGNPIGNIPMIGSTETKHGVAGCHASPVEKCTAHCITTSLLHNTKPCQVFWHPHTIGTQGVTTPVNNSGKPNFSAMAAIIRRQMGQEQT